MVEYPMQSYIVVGTPAKDISGMYISPDSEHYSIMPFIDVQKHLLLVGGEGHVPGSRWNPRVRYQRLADYAEKHFGIQKSEYR